MPNKRTAYHREYYRAHREKRRAQSKAHYAAHREEICARQNAKNAESSERNERRRAKTREYYTTHKKELNAKKREKWKVDHAAEIKFRTIRRQMKNKTRGYKYPRYKKTALYTAELADRLLKWAQCLNAKGKNPADLIKTPDDLRNIIIQAAPDSDPRAADMLIKLFFASK